jgi:hypothetical protein
MACHEWPALRPPPRRPPREKGEIKMQDPWEGRNAGMRCKSCVFFCPKGTFANEAKGAFGRCRRNAPTLKGFVPVWGMDWCGEHRLDENKLENTEQR